MQANNRSDKQTAGPARSFTESARRAQIVEVAIKVAASAGYANISFARIAKLAGLSSTGIISYNFDGKDDLIREVVSQILKVAEAYVTPRLAAATGARATLRAYIEARMAFLADYPDHLPALVEIISNLPREAPDRDRLLAQTEAWQGVHADFVRQAQATGEFRAFDPAAMAFALNGALDAVVTRKIREPDLDVIALGRELADLFDHAVRPLEEPRP
jgi:AcrR family transcriptional regulator